MTDDIHNYKFSMSGVKYAKGYDRIFGAVSDAIQYADDNDIFIPPKLLTRARSVGALKAGGDLPSILKKYHDEITQALINYLEKGGSVASHKNAFKRGMVYAFGEAFELGWLDAGREIPFDSNAQAWLNARMEAELAHIDSVFVQAKELRKDDGDFFQWVTARADGYTSSVRAVYNAASMFAMKGKLLTWHLGETEEHCPTCEEVLNGTRHRASWYIARNYIPRQPGAGMDCGGYNCDCKLTDQKGNEVTL